MSVPVRSGSTFVAGTPTVVLKIPNDWSAAYDVAPDGRFLFHVQTPTATGDEATQPEIVFVQNWHEELKQRVPVK
jgi:hypothetical protein